MSIMERTACVVTGATRSRSTMKGISTACATCGSGRYAERQLASSLLLLPVHHEEDQRHVRRLEKQQQGPMVL